MVRRTQFRSWIRHAPQHETGPGNVRVQQKMRREMERPDKSLIWSYESSRFAFAFRRGMPSLLRRSHKLFLDIPSFSASSVSE